MVFNFLVSQILALFSESSCHVDSLSISMSQCKFLWLEIADGKGY